MMLAFEVTGTCRCGADREGIAVRSVRPLKNMLKLLDRDTEARGWMRACVGEQIEDGRRILDGHDVINQVINRPTPSALKTLNAYRRSRGWDEVTT